MGKYIDDKVEEMKKVHPCIGDFRNTGLLGCLELVKNRKTKEPMARWNAPASEMEIMNKVMAKISELGMYTMGRWNLVFIAPPLCINKEEVDEGMDIISKALSVADEYCK